MKPVTVVTGGAGFIGSALIWKLNRSGESNILIVDSSDPGERRRNLAGLSFIDYQGKKEFLKAVVSGSFKPKIKTLFHLGACSSTTETDVDYLTRNNYEYSKHLARYCLETASRFIYASSAATYGDGRHGYRDDEDKIEMLQPLNAYAYSKHQFDLWARRNGLLDKIVGLKYFNIYGPNEYHKGDMRSMVSKGFEQIRDRGVIRLFKSDRPEYGDGEQERDFLYVKDAVEMTVFFSQHPELSGIFNIGSGVADPWNRLAAAIFRALGREPKIEYFPMPSRLRDKYQYHTRAEIEKLRRVGYRGPITSLEEGIRDYVQNYLLPGKYLSASEAQTNKRNK